MDKPEDMEDVKALSRAMYAVALAQGAHSADALTAAAMIVGFILDTQTTPATKDEAVEKTVELIRRLAKARDH